MRLWWVRHGPTHAKGLIGWTDLPADLSDTARLARLSAALPQAPVVSSDLDRAVATADALAGERPRLPHEPGLREMHFGQWEGRTAAELEVLAPERSRAFWEDPEATSPPGGESWQEAADRVARAADRLGRTHGEVILVAHFGAILTQLQRARGISAAEVLGQRIDTLSLTCLSFDGTWRVERVNHCP